MSEMPAFATVDDYIAAQPAEAQARLNELRAVVRAVAPDAAESISYGMPTYKLSAARLYFGAARKHCAVYGYIPEPVAEELRGLEIDKGTVRFPLDRPIPTALVTRLFQAQVAAQEAAGKR
jgi:uncharacterized protein YdhG (YjbR/CyaY superfamily)